MGIVKELIIEGVLNTYTAAAGKVAEIIPGEAGEKIAKKTFEAPIKAAEGIISVADKAVQKADDALVKAEEKERQKEHKFKEYLKKKREENPSFNHLTLLYDWESYGFLAAKSRSNYIFVDSDCNQVYYAQGQNDKRKQHINVFSQHNQAVGEIIEKPKFMDMGTSNYVIKTASGKMVSMKTKSSVLGGKYKIIPFNWIFHSAGIGKYEVLDEQENMLMKYTHKPFSAGQIMHIEYKDKNDEDLAVLIALSVYANYLMSERRPYREDGGYSE